MNFEIGEELSRFLDEHCGNWTHTHDTLRGHLMNTATILHSWGCDRSIWLTGLLHSVYGTESFVNGSPVSLSQRAEVRGLVGQSAERLVYLFCAAPKDSIFANVHRDNYFLFDRFEGKEVGISEEELGALLTVALANWLEQRPRTSAKHQFERQEEFILASKYLPAAAVTDFRLTYGLGEIPACHDD